MQHDQKRKFKHTLIYNKKLRIVCIHKPGLLLSTSEQQTG